MLIKIRSPLWLFPQITNPGSINYIYLRTLLLSPQTGSLPYISYILLETITVSTAG